MGKARLLTVASVAGVVAFWAADARVMGQASRAGTEPDAAAGVLSSIDAKRDTYTDVAKQIWGFAELGFQEQKSATLLEQQLESAGFTVQRGVADMPTGFVASYGSGKPVIGIVGEFDALPGLSQAVSPERKALTEGGPGHGCGHHLFGTASMAAAIAVKDWLQQTRSAGTVRYFGTPAEEGGGGKIFMIRAGLFKDVDAVVSWHPGDSNDASASSSLAMISARFKFHGVSAHAAAAPDKGRSALDGVEAMDYMVNMMREHVPQETRIHYVIMKGGQAPNVVPDYAETELVARHPDMRVLDGIWQRVLDAAQGAALGTGTTVEHELVSAYWNVLPNETLSKLQYKNLQRVGGFDYTAEEQAFAEKLRVSMIDPRLPLGSQKDIQPWKVGGARASTDMGDISWNVPTVQMSAATFVPGTPGHSWQAVASGGTTIGAKGMMVAAKTMALTAIDLYKDPSIIAKAREEFLQKRGPDFKYTTRVGDSKPPINFRKQS